MSAPHHTAKPRVASLAIKLLCHGGDNWPSEPAARLTIARVTYDGSAARALDAWSQAVATLAGSLPFGQQLLDPLVHQRSNLSNQCELRLLRIRIAGRSGMQSRWTEACWCDGLRLFQPLPRQHSVYCGVASSLPVNGTTKSVGSAQRGPVGRVLVESFAERAGSFGDGLAAV